ncbi:uncharacterized protein LOC133316287 [Gastrolobium bilobum]|uniref:uncharacterized protein LOC133316287 n=1 Tax=Gastrolobium bilobum TaxID=150636 RepID=UPI002AB2C69B|nr:uncharacterized protein LOC133316287 [Gastrolobium bilobum]
MKRKEKAAIGSSGTFHDPLKHVTKKRVSCKDPELPNSSAGQINHQSVLNKQFQQTKISLVLEGKTKPATKDPLMHVPKKRVSWKDQEHPNSSAGQINHQSVLNKQFQQTKITLVPEGKKKPATGQTSKLHCCGVCFDFKPDSHMFRRCQCNHPFCTDCISKYVANQIQQNILKVNCPNPKCSVELKPKHLQIILPKQVIDRWESARCESSIAVSEKTYCPFKNCSVLLVNDGGKVVTSSECPSCHRLFCAQCKVPWHAEMNCNEFRKLKRSKIEKDLDTKFLELAKGKMWQKCPKCYMYVQRRSGCEHMLCRCGCQFCYHCGENWNQFGHLCNSRRST